MSAKSKITIRCTLLSIFIILLGTTLMGCSSYQAPPSSQDFVSFKTEKTMIDFIKSSYPQSESQLTFYKPEVPYKGVQIIEKLDVLSITLFLKDTPTGLVYDSKLNLISLIDFSHPPKVGYIKVLTTKDHTTIKGRIQIVIDKKEAFLKNMESQLRSANYLEGVKTYTKIVSFDIPVQPSKTK